MREKEKLSARARPSTACLLSNYWCSFIMKFNRKGHNKQPVSKTFGFVHVVFLDVIFPDRSGTE